jgi:hypothetical protein
MSNVNLVGFDGDFTEEEIISITEAVERAEQHFRHAATNPLMPLWFIVKDDLPGQSLVFVAHRFGKEQAIVAHTVDELTAQLQSERPD